MTGLPIQDPKPAISNLLKAGETLTVEFKSDVKGLSDRDLVAAVVAMANTEGGLILLGVEDDGTVTGVQPSHQDVAGLVALIVLIGQSLPWLSEPKFLIGATKKS